MSKDIMKKSSIDEIRRWPEHPAPGGEALIQSPEFEAVYSAHADLTDAIRAGEPKNVIALYKKRYENALNALNDFSLAQREALDGGRRRL